MSEWDGSSSELNDMEEDWRGEIDNAIRLGGEQAGLLREMLDVLRNNERKYGDVFSPSAVAGRIIGAPKDYDRRPGNGEEPFAEDLFAFAQVAGIELSFLSVRSAVGGWSPCGTIDGDMNDAEASLSMVPAVREEVWL